MQEHTPKNVYKAKFSTKKIVDGDLSERKSLQLVVLQNAFEHPDVTCVKVPFSVHSDLKYQFQ